MGAAQRKFDEDFSEGAVQLVREAGKRIAQVARDLGVNEGTLRNWVNADLSQLGALPCSHILRPLPRRLAWQCPVRVDERRHRTIRGKIRGRL
jgi:transposase-like protein